MFEDITRVLIPVAAAFAVGMLITPILTHYLYLYKAWKKRPGKRALNGDTAHVFNAIHEIHEVRAPRMGGIVVWGSVVITMLAIAIAGRVLGSTGIVQLDFLSRSQTWIPISALLIGSLVGLLDDLMVIRPSGDGLLLRWRLLIVFALSAFIGWWFWAKLGISVIDIPLAAPLHLGVLFVPFFIFMSLCLYASGVIDGIDGLSGGVFASIFASYTVIAFSQHQVDLAGFCAAVVGGLLAFLWFNIPPARFFMTDTGTMGLTLTLGTVAVMTDSPGGGVGIFVLPIIGFLLVATVLSDVLQIFWKKVLKRKLLKIAPLHHHFEAIGWPGHKVVMRYWVLSVVFAFVGVIIALISIPAL